MINKERAQEIVNKVNTLVSKEDFESARLESLLDEAEYNWLMREKLSQNDAPAPFTSIGILEAIADGKSYKD